MFYSILSWCGLKEGKTKKGDPYGIGYANPVNLQNEEIDLEQIKFLIFNENILKKCRSLKSGSLVMVAIRGKEYSISELEEYESEI